MNWIDRISAAFVVICGSCAALWWISVWVPERDDYLIAVHDCYIDAGCGDRPIDDGGIEECWSLCSERIRTTR